MLSRMISLMSRRTGDGKSLRTTFPPNGNGSPVWRFHHSPRSTIFSKPDRAYVFYRIENFIERNDYEVEFTEEQLKRQKRAGHLARDSNGAVPQHLANL